MNTPLTGSRASGLQSARSPTAMIVLKYGAGAIVDPEVADMTQGFPSLPSIQQSLDQVPLKSLIAFSPKSMSGVRGSITAFGARRGADFRGQAVAGGKSDRCGSSARTARNVAKPNLILRE